MRVPTIVFAPVTAEQARFMNRVALALDARGVPCRFAVPGPALRETLVGPWGDRVQACGAETCDPEDPALSGLGHYDAWRLGWSPAQRSAEASRALHFWRSVLDQDEPDALVAWNGRDDVFTEAAALAAGRRGITAIFAELGPIRAPMTLALSRGGVNFAAQFRRPERLGLPLSPIEADALAAFRSKFVGAHVPIRNGPFALLPLQVDDDTQLYHYTPHFRDQVELVRAVVAALPPDLPLWLKPHPASDERLGRSRYAPLLRAIDRTVPAGVPLVPLLLAARLVITNNSSAGIEALLCDRPTVVLGQAHYAGRGFTHDYDPPEPLHGLLRDALAGPACAAATRGRDRYLFELLTHETLALTAHPLRDEPTREDAERVALRIADLLELDPPGSDWTPVFDELATLRQQLRDAIDTLLRGAPRDALLVLSPLAATHCEPPPGVEATTLEATRPHGDAHIARRAVYLLGPELHPGQRLEFCRNLRNAGAVHVTDLTTALGRISNDWYTRRFNALPIEQRDRLYRDSAYWDEYLVQTGVSAANTRTKRIQADALAQRIGELRPGELLEYGCGDGRILEHVAKPRPPRPVAIVGVDSSARMLLGAQRRLRGLPEIRLELGDARRGLPFDDGAFAATLTCGTLQHIHADDLPMVVHELHRVTRRTLLAWEARETHRSATGAHYTNPQTARTLHRLTFERCGPVRTRITDVRPLTGQDALLLEFALHAPLLTVLTLHHVAEPPTDCESLDYRNLFVSPRQLADLVDGLLADGYRFVTLSEARAAARGGGLPAKAIALTFDDGYASVGDAAQPLLAARGIRAAVFVTTGALGQSFSGNPRDGRGARLPMLSAEQVRTLRAAGWDIGAHTHTHRRLLHLPAAQAQREMAESKAILDELLGEPTEFFAFPYGEPGLAYLPEHVGMARAAGFETLLTMRPGFCDLRDDSYEWARIGIGADVDLHTLRAQLVAAHRAQFGWPAESAAAEPSLAERVRQVVKTCAAVGVERVALFGAGRHTARLLQTAPLWPLEVVGIVDDDRRLHGSRRYGLQVFATADLNTLQPDAIVISSDQYEEQIYERLAPLAARGVRVLRLYGAHAAK